MTQTPDNPMQQTSAAQDSDSLPPRALSDAELRGLAYFAIGITSEGSDKGYKLIVAGDNPRTPVITPAENSGYTIGTLQTDLGQHYQPNVARGENVPRDLINAYQEWADTNQPNWVLTDAQRAQAISDLGRNGNTIRAQGGREMDVTIKSHLDTFLASNDGITFVHNRDIGQVDKLMENVLTPLQETTLYRGAELDGQARLAKMTAKLYNQNETFGGRILGNIQNNAYQNIEDVSNAIDNLRPRITAPRDYVESGRDHALEGTKVFNALRNTQVESPLHQTWQNIVADPLVNPTLLRPAPETLPNLPPRLPTPAAENQNQAVNPIWQPAWQPEATVGPPLRRMPYETNPNIAAEYTVTKNLFLQPTEGLRFIEALDHGGAYSYGRPQQEGNNRPTSGFYVMGNDFVQWNREGVGQANIGGTWSDISRNDVTRVKNIDNTVDLNITENGVTRPLLHVDPTRPALRPIATDLQNQQVERAIAPPVDAPALQNPRQPALPPDRAPQDPRQRPPEQDNQNPRNPPQHDQPEHRQEPRVQDRGRQAVLLNDAAHPDHREFQLMRAMVGPALSRAGRKPDEDEIDNATAQLLAQKKDNNLMREIHRVEPSIPTPNAPGGDKLIALYEPHGRDVQPRWGANVKTDEAMSTPLAQSTQQINGFNQEQVLEQQQKWEQQQSQQQNQAGQTLQPPGGAATRGLSMG